MPTVGREVVTLDELDRLEKAATPGPWTYARTDEDCCDCRVLGGASKIGHDISVTDLSTWYGKDEPPLVYHEDGELIAAARNALPSLLLIADAMASIENPFIDKSGTCVACCNTTEHTEWCSWLLARRLAGGAP